MTVGDRIKSLRYSLELPQGIFAETVGIKKQTLYKYENNIVENIPLDTLRAIAKALGVTSGYLIDGEIQQPPEALWVVTFRSRLSSCLEAADQADIEASGIDMSKIGRCLEGFPITLADAYDIADEIGEDFLYLCGVTDEKKSAPQIGGGLTDVEQLLMSHVSSLSRDQQQMLLAQLNVLRESQRKERSPFPAD